MVTDNIVTFGFTGFVVITETLVLILDVKIVDFCIVVAFEDIINVFMKLIFFKYNFSNLHKFHLSLIQTQHYKLLINFLLIIMKNKIK